MLIPSVLLIVFGILCFGLLVIFSKPKRPVRTGRARCQIDDMVFYSTGSLHIKKTNDGLFINGKRFSKGLPEGVTMEKK